MGKNQSRRGVWIRRDGNGHRILVTTIDRWVPWQLGLPAARPNTIAPGSATDFRSYQLIYIHGVYVCLCLCAASVYGPPAAASATSLSLPSPAREREGKRVAMVSSVALATVDDPSGEEGERYNNLQLIRPINFNFLSTPSLWKFRSFEKFSNFAPACSPARSWRC